MRARQRHFNPGSAGATLAFDSRFIAGLSDGSAVSPWTDRANIASFSQVTVAERPTYKTNISGGSPAVLSEAGKQLTGPAVNYLTTNNASQCSVLFVGSSSNTSVDQAISSFRSSTGNDFLMYIFSNESYWAFRGGINGRRWNRPSANIISIESMVNSIVQINGTTITSSSHTHGGSSTNINTLCNINGVPASLRGYIGQILLFNLTLTSSQLKKITHAAALAFKIPCN